MHHISQEIQGNWAKLSGLMIECFDLEAAGVWVDPWHGCIKSKYIRFHLHMHNNKSACL